MILMGNCVFEIFSRVVAILYFNIFLCKILIEIHVKFSSLRKISSILISNLRNGLIRIKISTLVSYTIYTDSLWIVDIFLQNFFPRKLLQQCKYPNNKKHSIMQI